jgi:hypothetical protein
MKKKIHKNRTRVGQSNLEAVSKMGGVSKQA